MDELRELASLVIENGFTDFEFENENIRVRLSKMTAQVVQAPQPLAPATSVPAVPAAEALTAEADADLYKITSPIVGTFYRSPGPDKAPYVSEGSDQPFFEFQVEKQVQQIPGSGNLRYPDMLRSSNVEGEVLAQFVVDTTGKYENGSFKVLKSSHDLFTAAVRNALPTMRFYPAEVGGRKVKQLVQQPFTFSLQKS
jgi:protein TonB